MNASCEFDVDTLRPTYRLLLGIPGKSNAFAISRRLGLPEEIIEDAAAASAPRARSMEATIEKLEQVRQLMERDRTAAARQLRQAEENRRKVRAPEAERAVRLEKGGREGAARGRTHSGDARAGGRGDARARRDALRKWKNGPDQRINAARAEMRRKLNETQDSRERTSRRLRRKNPPARCAWATPCSCARWA